ncbi:MAG: UDP-N-acetylmuramoyl-L-alanine--D-glutamate ligase [Luteimonas sp.]
MDFAQLTGKRVALWGWGREGRAAWHVLHERGIGPLALFCNASEAKDALALDPGLGIELEATCERLSAFEVVVKSPGISPYKAEALAAAAAGTRFVGGTALWFAARAGADGVVPGTLCVTGTKGKSTTTALLAQLLRAGGHRTALAGNIGLPLLELLDEDAEYWAIEVSSYQTGDVATSGARPQIAVGLNIFPEHLDWHGSHERYVADKLRLFSDAQPRIAVLNAEDPILSALALPGSQVRWFNRADGWHLRGDALHRGDDFVMDAAALPLPGHHNRGNLCAALAAIEALGLDAAGLAPCAAAFQPLPHRLQRLGTRDGLEWVNDSISTTPYASLAALEVYRGERVALLVGGHDRGLDWSGFADAMRRHAPAVIVTIEHPAEHQNGARIHALLAPLTGECGFTLLAASNLEQAVAQARIALRGRGVVLLSPGAPSFGAYRDYTERGRHFARLAGFDPDAITTIPGLGIS